VHRLSVNSSASTTRRRHEWTGGCDRLQVPVFLWQRGVATRTGQILYGARPGYFF
jgi:hypothetical protein